MSKISFAQGIKPTFTSFEGEIYKLPASKKPDEIYRKSVDNYEKLGKISLPQLHIPETTDDVPFPQVDRKNLFGIYFKSSMTISTKGMYKFTLTSDDGSALWIEDKLIVDNGGIHTMSSMVNSVELDKGTYPIKVWYYNGVPNKYGIIFDAQMTYSTDEVKEVITFDANDLKFQHNSAKINPSYFPTLKKIVEKVNAYKEVNSIQITGHTDDSGSASFNKKLSLDRALSVKRYIAARLNNKNIEISIFGKGEVEPLVANDSAEGKSQNRRVEIIIN